MAQEGQPQAGTYLVTWSGHGDALGLWRIEASGALTLANSYTYTSWGTPTTTTHNGIADLGFRFTYVGQYDVQWDNVHSLGLAYMHARHYSPALGRFPQPDPDASEANLYAYAANNPVTEIDPDGTCFILCAIVNAVVSVAIYAVTTDSSKWNLGDAAREAVVGAATGFVGVGLLSRIGSIGRIASRASNAFSRLARPSTIVRAHSDRLWSYEKVVRKTLGSDEGRSWHLIEKFAGRTNAVIHRVRVGRDIVHQHVTHVGRYRSLRAFPDEWTGIRTIGQFE